MRAFLTRRLLLLVPTLLGVTLATFLMLHLTPGDPVTIMLGEFASASDVARLRAELGLDRPIVVQYFKFLGRAVRGDLGSSIRSRRPVQEEIAERLPPTLVLALAAQVLAVCAGIIAGVTAAAARRPSVDSAIVAVTLVGLSMPTFWSGLLLILLFSLTLGWLPITASGGLRALILPSVTLAAPAAAVLARVTRASVLEVLRQDYVRTARAKGVSERLVVYRHALRNALIPVLTVAALQFFFFQAEDGIRDLIVTGVQTCALPIFHLGLGQRVCFDLRDERLQRAEGQGMQQDPNRRLYARSSDPCVHGVQDLAAFLWISRSEERRVGKECRSRWSPYH